MNLQFSLMLVWGHMCLKGMTAADANLDVVRVCCAMAALIVICLLFSVDDRTHLVIRVGVGKAQHIFH